jgi:hypothetical protein
MKYLGQMPLPPTVEALLLFGSQSRGDAGYGSDIDLAVFDQGESIESLIEAKQRLMLANRDHPDVFFSIYSLKSAEKMASNGSLFLWHLKCEGAVLYERSGWIGGLLSRLQPYSGAKALRDIATFESVLADIEAALMSGSSTLLFEASTLFSILRSLGMIISMTSGSPSFRRWEPILRTKQLMGSSFALTAGDLSILHAARLIYARKCPADVSQLTSARCTDLHNKVADVATFSRRFVREALC